MARAVTLALFALGFGSCRAQPPSSSGGAPSGQIPSPSPDGAIAGEDARPGSPSLSGRPDPGDISSAHGNLVLTHVPDHGIPGFYMGSIAVADFNGDGLPDVVIGGYTTSAHDASSTCLPSVEAHVFLNVTQKGGPIRFRSSYDLKDLGVCGAEVVVGDFDGDKHVDFALAVKNGADTTAYFGNGDGTFRPVVLERNFGTHSMSFGMAAADIDQDGKDELIFNAAADPTYYHAGEGLWYRWNGTRFEPMQRNFHHAIAYGGTIAAGDLDGDRYPEIAVGGNASSPFGDYACADHLYGQIHHNRGGAIEPSAMTVIANYALRNYGRGDAHTPPNPHRLDNTCTGGDNVQYAIADVDRDGNNDVVVAGSGGFMGRPDMPGSTQYGFAILRNVDGTGTNFVTWENVGVGADGRPGNMGGYTTNSGVANVDLRSIAIGDLDGDGFPEILIEGHRRELERGDGSNYIFDDMLFLSLGGTDWRWLPGVLGLPHPIAECGAVIADFDGDGHNDILICGAERPFHTNGANAVDINTPDTIKTYLLRGGG